MISIRGIFEDGEVRLLEPSPSGKRAKVIVTFLDDNQSDSKLNDGDMDMNLFDDMTGVIGEKVNGSLSHDGKGEG